MPIDFGAALREPTPGMPPVASDVFEAPVPRNPYDMAPVKSALAPYMERIQTMQTEAAAVAIASDADNTRAIEMGLQSKKLKDAIEKARKQFVAEPKEFAKSVDSLAKSYTEALAAIEMGLKRKISDYQVKVEAERRQAELEARKAAIEAQRLVDEQARLAREKAEAEAAEAQRKADEAAKSGEADAIQLAEIAEAERQKANAVAAMEPDKVEAPAVPKSSGPTRTAEGSSYQVTVKNFKIQDEAAVPREYLAVDHARIRQAVKDGIANIPGVRIYETSETRFRR